MSDIRANRWEVLHYDDPDFQVMFRRNKITAGAPLCDITNHWHDDVEFLYVIEGNVYYEMEKETLKISAGEGIFVNAKQMHLIHSGDKDCVLLCLIFHPIILCSSEYITSNIIVPVLESEKHPYVFLSEKIEWHKRILKDVESVGEFAEKPYGHLEIMKILNDIWNQLFENLLTVSEYEEVSNDMSVIKNMTSFIHKNYRRVIRLKDICDAGNVGKTKCTELFDSFHHMSPMEYVRCYRIEKGAKLLEISDMSITEIAYEVGFSDSSYFSKTFGKLIGCSPQEYRSYGRGMSRYYEKDKY